MAQYMTKHPGTGQMVRFTGRDLTDGQQLLKYLSSEYPTVVAILNRDELEQELAALARSYGVSLGRGAQVDVAFLEIVEKLLSR